MADWKMIYETAASEREAYSTHRSLDQALDAAWALEWEDGEVLRIEGPLGEKMDATTIANHPTRPR